MLAPLGQFDLHQWRVTGVRRVLHMSYIRYQRMRILSPGVPQNRHHAPAKTDRLQPVQYAGVRKNFEPPIEYRPGVTIQWIFR